jgi:hypothetical protein
VKTAGSFGCSVAANTTGERELLEEASHTFDIFRFVWVDLRVYAFEVGVGEDGWGTVAGT